MGRTETGVRYLSPWPTLPYTKDIEYPSNGSFCDSGLASGAVVGNWRREFIVEVLETFCSQGREAEDALNKADWERRLFTSLM